MGNIPDIPIGVFRVSIPLWFDSDPMGKASWSFSMRIVSIPLWFDSDELIFDYYEYEREKSQFHYGSIQIGISLN